MNKDKDKTVRIRFDWPIEPTVRYQIEDLLKRSGYTVHGGGTNRVERTADISLSKKGGKCL